jgi:hypothetical protein
MSLTLLEASKLNSGDVVRSGVIEMFARSSEILRVLPFLDVPGGAYHYTQEGVLPGVAFRGVNEAFAESTGIVVPQVEMLRIAGGDLDVDRAIMKRHGAGVRATHEMMKVKALSLYIGKKFIKGDSLTNPKEFDGLQNRITGPQLIDAGSTNGGDPLSLIKLDEAIDAVDFPTHLIMSKAMVRRLTAAARSTTVGGLITYGKDEFGRKITMYNDLPILVLDHDETGARVLDFNEVGPGGSTATATSIYILSIGNGMISGLQNGIMEVRDLGEIDAKPVWRTRVEWDIGLVTMHPRCAARLWGISNAAVVA